MFSVVVIFSLCNWWFDRPENWSYVIPIIVNAVSGKYSKPDALDIFVTLLDGLLNAKIFAVVSCLIAASENN